MTLPLVQAAMDGLRIAHRDLLRVVDPLSNDDWSRPVLRRRLTRPLAHHLPRQRVAEPLNLV